MSRVLSHQDGITVGPDSVGYKLISKARVFGGGTTTSTDIAVASGFCDNIGDREMVKSIPEDVRIGALNEIKRKIEAAVDRVKVLTELLSILLTLHFLSDGWGCTCTVNQEN